VSVDPGQPPASNPAVDAHQVETTPARIPWRLQYEQLWSNDIYYLSKGADKLKLELNEILEIVSFQSYDEKLQF
jgi:hypothetical protein